MCDGYDGGYDGDEYGSDYCGGYGGDGGVVDGCKYLCGLTPPEGRRRTEDLLLPRRRPRHELVAEAHANDGNDDNDVLCGGGGWQGAIGR